MIVGNTFLGGRADCIFLTMAEADKIMSQPDIKDPVGIRDRAILETFYSTGMRRMELIGLSVQSLDVDRGTIKVYGKGRRERMIPIGERAVAWIDKYSSEVRPRLVVPPDDGTLFLSIHGAPLSEKQVTHVVSKHVNAARIGKKGACHMFRHTMATLMLENGADIRYVQHMLGHAELSTTQIYTQVSIRKPKEVHTATHPSAKLDLYRPKPQPSTDETAI